MRAPARTALLACAILAVASGAASLTTVLEFDLTQLQCAARVFTEANLQVGPLTPMTTAMTCPGLQLGNVSFSDASIGFVGAAASQWTMADLVRQNMFLNGVFTIAVWFQVATPSNPTLARFGTNGQFLLTARGASMQAVIQNSTTQWGPQLQTAIGLAMPNQTYAMVLSVGVTQAQLLRTSPGSSQSFSFAMPEATVGATSVIFPRTTSWGDAILILGSAEDTTTTILGFRVVDATMNALVLANNPLPLNCPSVASFALNATENLNFAIDFTPYVLDTVLSSAVVHLATLPSAGALLQISGVLFNYTFNPKIVVHPRVDSFTYSASNVLCGSAVLATVTIYVTPVDHPPSAQSSEVTSTLGALTPLTFTGSDPDGQADLAQLNVFAHSVSSGALVFCANMTQPTSLIVTLPASGLGLCYTNNFTSPALARSSGEEIVGQVTILFNAVDRAGQQSEFKGIVSVNLVNPAAQDLSFSAIEQQPVTLAGLGVAIASVYLVSLPSHGGIVLSAAPDVFAPLNQWINASMLSYVSDAFYTGNDSFQAQVVGVMGFVSPVLDVAVTVNYTYHPSTLVAPTLINAQFAHATPLNLTLVNLDLDSYSSSVLLSMPSTTGVISIPNVPSTVQVLQGSSCVEVGCASHIELVGLPSDLAACLAIAEYTPVAPINNIVSVQIYDDVKNISLAVNASVVIMVFGGIWGTGDPAQRGNTAIGAAILSAVVAAVVVLGGCCTWLFLPSCSQRCLQCKAWAKRSRDSCACQCVAAPSWNRNSKGPSSPASPSPTAGAPTGNVPKTLVRPPSKVRVLEPPSGNPDALMDASDFKIPPPPGLGGINIVDLV